MTLQCCAHMGGSRAARAPLARTMWPKSARNCTQYKRISAHAAGLTPWRHVSGEAACAVASLDPAGPAKPCYLQRAARTCSHHTARTEMSLQVTFAGSVMFCARGAQ